MSFDHTALFLLCATIVFVLGWVGLLPIESRHRRTHKWLLAHGRPVVAKIKRIRKQAASRGALESWVIIASWADPEDGTEYRFQSAPLEFDPSVQLESGAIQVLVDPTNPRRHYVDVSEIRVAAGYQ